MKHTDHVEPYIWLYSTEIHIYLLDVFIGLVLNMTLLYDILQETNNQLGSGVATSTHLFMSDSTMAKDL